MKKIFIIASLLFYTSYSLSFLNLTPEWVIINNTTPFDLSCKFYVACYPPQGHTTIIFENKNLTIKPYKHRVGDDIMFCVTVDCPAQTIQNLDQTFFVENRSCKTEIKSIEFTHTPLQLTIAHDFVQTDDKYFSVCFDEENGITIINEPLSIYTKYSNQFQHAAQSLLVVIADMIN